MKHPGQSSGAYPISMVMLGKMVSGIGTLRNIKSQAPNYKQISNSNIEAPCSPPEADRESSKCKEEIPFYYSSLANPAANCGERARCSIFNDQNKKQVSNFEF
jgi:hypothetical protein